MYIENCFKLCTLLRMSQLYWTSQIYKSKYSIKIYLPSLTLYKYKYQNCLSKLCWARNCRLLKVSLLFCICVLILFKKVYENLSCKIFEKYKTGRMLYWPFFIKISWLLIECSVLPPLNWCNWYNQGTLAAVRKQQLIALFTTKQVI
jgi:hypothetical protein